MSSIDTDTIEELFLRVFTQAPWNDDWSDTRQLRAYLFDITGNPNSLSMGLFEAGELVGISLGTVIHWCTGTEYFIREFCVSTKLQNRGFGSFFLAGIERYLLSKSITQIILSTDRDTQAFSFYRKNGFSTLDKTVFLHKKFQA